MSLKFWLINFSIIISLIVVFQKGSKKKQRISSKLQTVINDMKGSHESKLNGVPLSYNWSLKPRINFGNKPPKGWTAMLPWGQVYRDSKPIRTKNTRIQIKNLQAWYLDTLNKWHLWGNTSDLYGKNFNEDYIDNKNIDAAIKQERSGGISIKLIEGFNFHYWRRRGRYSINPTNIKGVWISAEARLIVEDIKQKDDRKLANFLMGVGADYWMDTTALWDNFKTNGDIAIGKLKYIKREWQTFNMHTLDENTLINYPPPPIK
ncbi:MAG: hypothetical protein ACOVNR_04690 [Chitinophagaceae bacterium]